MVDPHGEALSIILQPISLAVCRWARRLDPAVCFEDGARVLGCPYVGIKKKRDCYVLLATACTLHTPYVHLTAKRSCIRHFVEVSAVAPDFGWGKKIARRAW